METGYANTATIISFSVQQNADGMLNLLLTDKAALNAPMSAFVISDQSMVSAFCKIRLSPGRACTVKARPTAWVPGHTGRKS